MDLKWYKLVYPHLSLFFIVAFILSSGCLSEKELTCNELISIALDDPEVADLINGYEYEILDSGPATLNKQDVYYVRISINKGRRPTPYSVFISKVGNVILVSKEFPSIDPATLNHGVNNSNTG